MQACSFCAHLDHWRDGTGTSLKMMSHDAFRSRNDAGTRMSALRRSKSAEGHMCATLSITSSDSQLLMCTHPSCNTQKEHKDHAGGCLPLRRVSGFAFGLASFSSGLGFPLLFPLGPPPLFAPPAPPFGEPLFFGSARFFGMAACQRLSRLMDSNALGQRTPIGVGYGCWVSCRTCLFWDTAGS